MSEIAPLLYEALKLMLTGMGFVFAFLALLIGAIKVLAAVAGQDAPVATASAGAGQPSGEVPASVIAAISAAVHRYRNTQK